MLRGLVFRGKDQKYSDVHLAQARAEELRQGLHDGSLHGDVLLHEGMKFIGGDNGSAYISSSHNGRRSGSAVYQGDFAHHMALAKLGNVFPSEVLDLDRARKDDKNVVALFELPHDGLSARVVDFAGDGKNGVKLGVAQAKEEVARPQFRCLNHASQCG